MDRQIHIQRFTYTDFRLQIAIFSTLLAGILEKYQSAIVTKFEDILRSQSSWLFIQNKLFFSVVVIFLCLKITEKVSFNIASEASCGQKFVKNAKNGHFDEFLKTWSLRSNSVTRQVSFHWTKISEKCQNSKIQMRLFRWFSNTVILFHFHLGMKKTRKLMMRPDFC